MKNDLLSEEDFAALLRAIKEFGFVDPVILRAATDGVIDKQFSSYRKLGRVHQSVLIFCKGDPRKIPATLGKLRLRAVDFRLEDEEANLATLAEGNPACLLQRKRQVRSGVAAGTNQSGAHRSGGRG